MFRRRVMSIRWICIFHTGNLRRRIRWPDRMPVDDQTRFQTSSSFPTSKKIEHPPDTTARSTSTDLVVEREFSGRLALCWTAWSYHRRQKSISRRWATAVMIWPFFGHHWGRSWVFASRESAKRPEWDRFQRIIGQWKYTAPAIGTYLDRVVKQRFLRSCCRKIGFLWCPLYKMRTKIWKNVWVYYITLEKSSKI